MTHPDHVVLVGLPGCGKSTVAPLLADRLGCAWIDSDQAVETRLGMSVSRIFAELGEKRFRAEEHAVVETALRSPQPMVIAAGGGLVAQPRAAEALARHATVVFLDAGHDELVDRIGDQAHTRPLLAGNPGGALRHLRVARTGAHGQAQLRIAVDNRSAATVAEDVAAALSGAVRVATAHPYLVRVGAGLAGNIVEHIPAPARRVLVVADRAVAGLADTIAGHLRAAQLTTVVAPIAGGEAAKSWAVAGALLERCSESGLERDDCIVAVGGGTVGDVAGMVAATYMRGIAWLVVPTTLLSMVDSAVGGKTGVNLRRGKNLAGAFWQPRAVICDPDVLSTLDERSFRSAFAEIVKSSMIGPDDLAGLIDECLPAALARDLGAVSALVRGCAALKAEVVAGDERETGRRAVLNYGHTVGHAVEALTGMGTGLDHGEAVAFGMRVAGALSVIESGCPAEVIAHQDAMLDECGLAHRPFLRSADIVAQLGGDKKARGGVPRWVLLRRRGDPVAGIVVERQAVDEALAQVLAA
jgi:3-dehydroquinate synthase